MWNLGTGVGEKEAIASLSGQILGWILVRFLQYSRIKDISVEEFLNCMETAERGCGKDIEILEIFYGGDGESGNRGGPTGVGEQWGKLFPCLGKYKVGYWSCSCNTPE